jgi:hypothetical protein
METASVSPAWFKITGGREISPREHRLARVGTPGMGPDRMDLWVVEAMRTLSVGMHSGYETHYSMGLAQMQG